MSEGRREQGGMERQNVVREAANIRAEETRFERRREAIRRRRNELDRQEEEGRGRIQRGLEEGAFGLGGAGERNRQLDREVGEARRELVEEERKVNEEEGEELLGNVIEDAFLRAGGVERGVDFTEEELAEAAAYLGEIEGRVEDQGIETASQRFNELYDREGERRVREFLAIFASVYGNEGLDNQTLDRFIGFLSGSDTMESGKTARGMDILRFFIAINDGLDIVSFSQNEHQTMLKVIMKQWVSEVERFVRANVARGTFEEELLTFFVASPHYILSRLTSQEINWAIKYAKELYVNGENDEEEKRWVEKLVHEVLTHPYTSPPVMPDNLVQGTEIYELSRRLSSKRQNWIDDVWQVFLVIVYVMHRVLSGRLKVTDVLLSRENYRRSIQFNRRVDNKGELRATQAFPFLIFESREGDFDLVDDILIPDLYNKYMQLKDLRRQEIIEDIWIKLKVKIIFTQEGTFGPHNESRLWIMDLNLLDVLPPEEYIREGEELVGTVEERVREVNPLDKALLWSILEDENEFREGFLRLFHSTLKEAPEEYKDKFEFLDEARSQINLKSICIGYSQLGCKLTRQVNGESIVLDPQSTILKPAHCSTASEGLIKKCVGFSEVTNYGICIYEALWSLKNYDKIEKRETRMTPKGKKSYRTKDDRLYLILKDFSEESEEVQSFCLSGDTVALAKYTKQRNIQLFFWDGAPLNLPPELNVKVEELSILRPTIMIFSRHAICAKTFKILEQHKLKCAKAIQERSERFVCRPLEVLKERPEEENWYLDIECSIDKKTGIFTPYLIVLIRGDKGLIPKRKTPRGYEPFPEEEKEFAWWGPNCRNDLIEWMKKKAQKDPGAIDKRAGGNKICLWGYNILRFDAIFFLIDILKAFVGGDGDVDIKGSIENPKAVSVNGILTIRDLLKIVPGMSLEKAGQFWNTTKRKTHVNHDEITDEMIRKINIVTTENEGDLTAEEWEILQEINEDERHKLKELKKELGHYCINDVYVTIECIEKYMDWVWDNFKVSPYIISTASLSMKIFLTHYHPAINKTDRKLNYHHKNLYGMPRDRYDVVRKSYKGGLVLVPKQLNDAKALSEDIEVAKEGRPVFCYDINSSYPAAMMKDLPYKYLKSRTFDHGWLDISTKQPSEIVHTNLYGIRGLEWDESTYMPLIPKRTRFGLNTTLKHEYIDYVWGCELAFAMLSGNIKKGYIFEELMFEKGPVYKSFVEDLYKRKVQFQQNNDPCGTKLIKLILNSLYGKAAQKLYPTKKLVKDIAYWADQIIEPPLEVCDGIWCITIDELAGCSRFHVNSNPGAHPKMPDKKHIGTLVHLASYITAQGRINLLKFCNEIGWDNVLYTDTDSCFTFTCLRDVNNNPHKSLPTYSQEEKVELQYTKDTYLDTEKLGYLKEEKNENDLIIFRFIAVAKKMYLLQGIDKDGQIITYIKSKGLSTGNMDLNDFLELKNTGKLLNKKGGRKWLRRRGYVQIQDNIKNLNVTNFRTYINNGLDSLPFIE